MDKFCCQVPSEAKGPRDRKLLKKIREHIHVEDRSEPRTKSQHSLTA